MSWAVTADVFRFDEAISWFKSKVPLSKPTASSIEDYSGSRAFTMAGVEQLNIVQFVHNELVKSIKSGEPYADWRKRVVGELKSAWGRKDSPRMLLIFRNATSQANNAGRWAQQQDPDVVAVRPFLMFDGTNDARQSAICRALDGTIKPASDPWWKTHRPQMHHACRSLVRTLTAAQAVERGITQGTPTVQGTNKPVEANKGFGGEPSSQQWEPDRMDYDPAIFREYQLKRSELARSKTRPSIDK